MKKAFGFFIIVLSLPALWWISTNIKTEINIAQAHEEQMTNAIHLPEVEAQLPVTLIDRNGQTFSEEYVEWRQPLSLQEIPQIAQEIFITSEDADFYTHIGFDLSAIIRAVVANSNSNTTSQGGSTITQQLVRMRYLSEEKTYERKLTELFYAYELEKEFDKEAILTMYLNESYFSNQVYGIGGAATYYFQKPLQELSIAEIAFIAAIPNNPSLYNPLKNYDQTKARQERLLDTLAANGAITEGEAKNYKADAITLNVKDKIQSYPMYSTYVLQELKWLIAEKESYADRLSSTDNEEEKKKIKAQLDIRLNTLFQNGLIIHTALDPTKQQHDEEKMSAILGTSPWQAAGAAIENQSREIVSLYAGKNYEKFDFHRAFQGTRQPGSAFKPLAVYAPFFETTSHTPDSIVNGGRYCVGSFCPQNYGGYTYGDVSIRTAFRHSYNTSALRLFQTVGVETAFHYLNRFHFRSIVEKDYNYAASLGGLTYGVTALELADAYTSFIDGSYVLAHSIRKVTALDGTELYSWDTQRDQIWSPKTVKYMRELLADVVANGTGQGVYSNSSYVGAKTGTTNDYRDYWLAGLNNEYTAAVWLGYDKPQSMQQLEEYKIHHQLFNVLLE
ncbi:MULTISPECIES: transglycosylase domain-containing protein [Lysinibacillus]|uniref:transglycosylase domain-containing protein n=1 Tax=Lysinibacillus TaxID=400634 RepID=UPI0008263651|nr:MULTISPECIES: transglycosylase domain-containing protein [Lysinibacillus]MCT1540378.1 penicillin-binding protein [Lysinibacillus capsici]MCT1571446.1 penicillin-binding protein [Lysinibacillus capsici]MCT1647764.1 penicillin-binding protein [Lysinibacillus capsici]MCT1726305.1 penicillin-binding protein [Lysinibacillus capsici]MCT1783410.1 penicillin-binding protein [Lysinibacillus capsici]